MRNRLLRVPLLIFAISICGCAAHFSNSKRSPVALDKSDPIFIRFSSFRAASEFSISYDGHIEARVYRSLKYGQKELHVEFVDQAISKQIYSMADKFLSDIGPLSYLNKYVDLLTLYDPDPDHELLIVSDSLYTNVSIPVRHYMMDQDGNDYHSYKVIIEVTQLGAMVADSRFKEAQYDVPDTESGLAFAHDGFYDVLVSGRLEDLVAEKYGIPTL